MGNPKQIVSCGEYNPLIVNQKDGQAYSMASGSPVKLTGQPSKVVSLWPGLHTQYLGDSSGNAYPFPDSQTVGASIGNNVLMAIGDPGGGDPGILKKDGTLWISGAQVPFPAGAIVKDVWFTPNGPKWALDTAGNVYSWGFSGYGANWMLGQGGGTVSAKPTKIPLIAPAAFICANTYSAHFVLTNGQMWACGLDPRYYGYALGQIVTPVAPIRVDQLHKFPAAIASITNNYTSTIAILSDGSMWSWGENTSGTCGNGQETNMKATNPTYSAPWYNTPQWNLPATQGGALFVQLAVQIGKGIQWSFLNRGCYNFYQEAEDVSGTIYTWGRNKSGVLMNGVVGTSDQQDKQPNLWDVLVPTKVTPFGTVVVPPVNQPPSAAVAEVLPVTLPTNLITLDGSASIDPDGTIASYAWLQLSGPIASIIGTGAKVQALLSTPGTYVFQLTVTDNKGAIDVAQISVIVNAVPVCPPAPAPRTLTGLNVNVYGTWVPIPITTGSVQATFSDGGNQ